MSFFGSFVVSALVWASALGALGCGDDAASGGRTAAETDAGDSGGPAPSDAAPDIGMLDGATGAGDVASLAAGNAQACAILRSGRLKCWGQNAAGELGHGNTAHRGDDAGEMGAFLPATDLGTGRKVLHAAIGVSHACAVLDEGTLKCWGSNTLGELGTWDLVDPGSAPGTMGDRLPAVDLGRDRHAKSVVVAHSYTCALLDDGSVKCWGANVSGSLGLGNERSRPKSSGEMGDALPRVDLGSGRTAKALSAFAGHTCVILDNDQLKCWGRNDFGQLGLGDTRDRGALPSDMGDALPAVDLGAGRTVRAVSTSLAQTCVVLDNGDAKCWGSNGGGLLGQGDTKSRGRGPGEMGDNLPPIAVGVGRRFVAIECGGNHVCGLLDSGAAKCWGLNDNGQLGLGDTRSRGRMPGEMGDALPALDIGAPAVGLAGGTLSMCALLVNGQIKCWGDNDRGQLGLGDSRPRGKAAVEMGAALPPVDVGP